MSEIKDLKNAIAKLNEKCAASIKTTDEGRKKIYEVEYVSIRNFLKKESFYARELAKITDTSPRKIREILTDLRFIRFKGKKVIVNTHRLRALRRSIIDMVSFLNYPVNKKEGKFVYYVNQVNNNKKRVNDFKIILVGMLEADGHSFLSELELDKTKDIVKFASWGLAQYYFKELFSIYVRHFPELWSIKAEEEEEREEEKEDSEPEEILDGLDEEININDVISENHDLRESLNESRAASDFLAMQNEDLKRKIEKIQQKARDQNILKVFKDFNSLENNQALDAFFIASYSLNKLKKSGWKPTNPDINSSLFIFDLFSNFFAKQNLSTKYEIDQLLEITPKNVAEFEYKGTELKEGMKTTAKVLAPAWFYKNNQISKAKIVEVRKKSGK